MKNKDKEGVRKEQNNKERRVIKSVTLSTTTLTLNLAVIHI